MSSSDEWSDGDECDDSLLSDRMGDSGAAAHSASIETTDVKYLTRGVREELPVTADLLNMVETSNTNIIYRCEPARTPDGKKYPGIVIPESLRCYHSLLITMYVHNAISDPVMVRVPDFKTKADDTISFTRNWDGSIWLNKPGTLPDHTVYFKKKSHDKKGKDVAFKLGSGFLSRCGNITPVFTFVLAPFTKDGLDMSKACRTSKFQVLSKRQTARLPRANKRPKVNNEIKKIETNIREAEIALSALMSELRHVRHGNARFVAETRSILRLSARMPPGSVKMAIEFALRNYEQNQSGASL